MHTADGQQRGGAVILGWLAACLLPLLLIIDTAAAAIDGWQLHEAGGLVVLPVLAVATLVASIALLAFLSIRQFLARNARRLLLASCGLVMGLGIGELVISSYAPPAPFHCRAPRAVYEFEPNSFAMPGVFGPAVMSFNKKGLRGAEISGAGNDYRILCAGGSSTECCYLDDTETWPTLLQSQLEQRGFACRVSAATVSSYASGHHLRFLRNADIVDRVDCVVLLVGANDLLRTILRQSVSGATPPLWSRSRMADLLQRLWNVQLGNGLIFDVSGEEISVMRWGRPITEFDLWAAIESDLESYAGRIRATIAAARQRNVRVVFVSQPCLWAEFLTSLATSRLRWAGEPTSPRRWEALEATSLRNALDRYNSVLADVCDEAGVEFVDAATMSGVEQYFYDDFHLNESGCRRLTAIVSEHLLSHAPERTLDSED